MTRLEHGKDCPKVPHSPEVPYCHEVSWDGDYEIDGVSYCGRCHYWLGCPVENVLHPELDHE
jgi:hypothetical protein